MFYVDAILSLQSLEGIIKASKEELVLCPGLGPQKVCRDTLCFEQLALYVACDIILHTVCYIVLLVLFLHTNFNNKCTWHLNLSKDYLSLFPFLFVVILGKKAIWCTASALHKDQEEGKLIKPNCF